MKIKVHWIIDGIAEIEASSLEEAERLVNQELTEIINKSDSLKNRLGATSIQGKAYLPGSASSN